MKRDAFLQEYFKSIQYLCELKNTLNILVGLLELNRGNLIEYQIKMLKII